MERQQRRQKVDVTFKPESINEKKSTLRDILEEKYDRDYEINREDLEVWRYVKGARKEYRIRKRDRELVGEEIWKLYQECTPKNKTFGIQITFIRRNLRAVWCL